MKMNKWVAFGLGAAIVLAASSASAQSKTITGQTESVIATVEAIDTANRALTVKKPDGKYEVIYVPAGVKQFDAVKAVSYTHLTLPTNREV